MADNVAQQIKNLSSEIERLDLGLKDVAKNSRLMEQAISEAIKKGGADAKETIKSIQELQKVLNGKFGDGKEIKIAIGIEKDKLKREIAEAENKIKGLMKQNPMRIQAEGIISTYKQQLAQLVDFEKQFARINQIVNGGKTNTGTLLSNARATEMNKVRTTMESINKQIDRRTQLEKTLSDLQARNGKSAMFEGQRRSAEWFNKEIQSINQNIERYKRTLASLGGRGRQALGSLGGDGTKTAIKDQMAAMRELYNLTKQYRQMQEKKRTGGIVNNQDLVDTRNRLREILNQMKQIEKEHPGSRKTAAMRLETERLRDRWREVNRVVKPVKSSLDAMLPTLRSLASAFGVAFSVQGLVQFGKKLVETRGEFELQQVALRSILQNKQLADEIWDKTMQAALQSPFTAMQLTRYTKQLAAYRIETEKLFDTTKRLADVSAGLGVDMQRLILAYGQVKAANYLRASEIRQFTEAGVNVLGELTSYFNETRDGMYNTAKVMDMVQKRMVTFSDIEAIFKRMTDEGGIFFNMQYIQSQTVKGQINKLRDAYDQMLNSIGKANEGPIKNMVSLLLNIVKNWREWKTVLDSILWPALTIAVIKFGRGLLMVDASAKIASKSLHGLTLVGAKVRRSLSDILNILRKFPAGGIWGAVGIGAAVVAVTALVNHAKAVAEINKEYDEQKNRLRETARSLEDYQRRVNENNETIKNRTKIAKDDKEAQDKLKKAQQDNKTIVNKLTSDYPEFAKSIKLASDKQADLGTIAEDTNNKLRNQIALLEASKGDFFTQDLKTNIAQYQSAVLKQEDEVETNYTKAQNAYEDFVNEREKSLSKLKQQYEDGEISLRKYKKAVEKLNKETPDKWITGVLDAGKDAQKQRDFLSSLVRLPKGVVIPKGEITNYGVDEFDKDLDTREKDLRKNLEGWSSRIRIMYVNQLEKLNGGAIDDVKSYVRQNGTLIDNWFKYGIGAGWKDINESVVKIAESLGISTEEARKIVEEEINKTLMSAYGKTIKLDWSKIETDSTDQETPEEKQAKIDAAWRRRIQLLEEMKKRYDELSKSAYGYAKSNSTVRKEFEKSWGKIFGRTLSMDAIAFMSASDMEASFETILKKAGAASEAVREEIQKKADSYGARIPIDVQVRIREDFGRQMEEAFGNYELTLDLQKLNLPSDVLSDLFDLDTVDLSDLRRRVTTFYNELAQEGDIDRDDMKSIEGYIKKIDDMERKQQRERIKDYAKYLEYELSERAKISMEYARKIAQVQIEKFSDDEEENLRRRQKIMDGLTKERDERLAKQDWEDFKGAEVYVQMMEDLEKHGTVALRTMREELEKIRKKAKNLSPRALKEVVSAIEKIREIEINRTDPFKGLADAQKDVKNALRDAGVSSKSELYANADAAEKALVSVQREKQEVDRIVAAKKNQKELQEEIVKLSNRKEIADVLYNPDTEDEITALTELINKKQKEANDIVEERRNLEREILNLSMEQSRLIDEEGTEGITNARKAEIATRKAEISNRLEQITQQIDAKTIGENIAKTIVDEINRYIKANGELKGLSPQDLSDSRGEKEQQELSEREKSLQKAQEEYNKAINAIDTYNKQVARLMVFIDTWTGKVQELWSSISELSSAYEGEFGNWVSRWGGVVDTTFQQVSKLSKAFVDFQAVRADYLKSATKKVEDKASSAVDNMEKASETAQTQANTAATQANTLAKIENATASNLAAMGNSAVGTSAAAATPAVTTFSATLLMAMGWVGLIMAALEALFAIIKAIAGAHDSQLDKQIEDQQKKIDALRDAYARLERQIERTWSSVSYMQTYEQQVQNIREQIDAMEAQMAAERAKKNTDDNAVRQYQRDIQDAYDQLDELEQKSIEVFGGIGEEGYRSAAEGFVEAWKSAFLETGDGLQGLQDHFDEFLQDWFVKQATMQGVAKYYEKVFDYINGIVEDGSVPTYQEIENARELADEAAINADEFMRAMAGVFGIGDSGSLSGLAAGIQGMTEEQANILEAYWNSVRMYTANIDMNVARIAEMLGVGGPTSNPMLTQLQTIAKNTGYIPRIYDMLDGTRRNLGNGQGFVTYNQ